MKPRTPLLLQGKKRLNRVALEVRRRFLHWKFASATSSKKRVLSKVAGILKRTMIQSFRHTVLGAFRKWQASTISGDIDTDAAST